MVQCYYFPLLPEGEQHTNGFLRHLGQCRFNLVTCRSLCFAGWMPARHVTFLSITGSVTQESVLMMVPMVPSHGPGMNYELQLTEDHFEAALSWQRLEKPSYGLAHSLWASPGDGRGFSPFPIVVRSASCPGRRATSQCQPTSTEQMARGVRERFQTAGWQKRIHPDESENLYAQLILLESRTGMGIAHEVGMQGNLQQRLLSTKQFNQLGCSMKEQHALKQGGEGISFCFYLHT